MSPGERRQGQRAEPGRFRMLVPAGAGVARAHQPADERVGALPLVAESRLRRLQHRPRREHHLALAHRPRQQSRAIGCLGLRRARQQRQVLKLHRLAAAAGVACGTNTAEPRRQQLLQQLASPLGSPACR